MNGKSKHIAVTFLLGIALVAGVSCTKKAVQPKPEIWNVYAGCASTGKLYILDADSLTVLDSIPDMREVNSIVASPDGRWLYVQTSHQGSQSRLSKIDVTTKAQAAVLPKSHYSEAALLKGGAMLISGLDLCQDEVINPDNLAVQRILADSLCRRRGCWLGTKVAALQVASESTGSTLPFTLRDSVIRVTNVETGEVYGSYVSHLATGEQLYFPYDVVLHPDGRRVLIIAPEYGPGTWFVIGDVITGETVYQYELASPFGEVAVSDDGSYAAVSDPGQFGNPETNPPTLDIFDLKTYNHLKRFNMFSAQIRFFAGGQKLLSGPRNWPSSGGALRIIDISSLTVVRDVTPLPGLFMGAIGVGRRP